MISMEDVVCDCNGTMKPIGDGYYECKSCYDNQYIGDVEFGAESEKLGIILRIDRDDKSADVLGVFSSYAEGKKAMTHIFKEALKERAEDYEEDLMSFTQGKKEFEWYETRSKKRKHLDFYHPTAYDELIVLKEYGIETLADFEENWGAETFNAESKFDKLAKEIAADYRKKGKSPEEALKIGEATAAKIGRAKFGKKKFARMGKKAESFTSDLIPAFGLGAIGAIVYTIFLNGKKE